MAVIQVFVDSGLFVLIWLVQLVIYPSFCYAEKETFLSWHAGYVRRISLIVGPLIIIQIGVEGLHLLHGEYHLFRIILLTAVIFVTSALSVPCHRLLAANRKDENIINRLLQTNWLRTAIWTLLFMDTVFSDLEIPFLLL